MCIKAEELNMERLRFEINQLIKDNHGLSKRWADEMHMNPNTLYAKTNQNRFDTDLTYEQFAQYALVTGNMNLIHMFNAALGLKVQDSIDDNSSYFQAHLNAESEIADTVIVSNEAMADGVIDKDEAEKMLKEEYEALAAIQLRITKLEKVVETGCKLKIV